MAVPVHGEHGAEARLADSGPGPILFRGLQRIPICVLPYRCSRASQDGALCRHRHVSSVAAACEPVLVLYSRHRECQCRLCGILMYLPWGDATFDMDRSGYGPAILHRDLQRSSRNTSDLSKDATHYPFTAKGGGYRCRRGRVIRRRRGRGQSSNDPEGETGDYLGTDLVVARRGIAGHSKCSLAKGSEAFDRAHTIAIKV